VRCGVSAAFERSGWLAPSVPVAPFWGLAFFELLSGRVFLPGRGSKEANPHQPETGSARRGLVTKPEGIQMTVMDGYRSA